MPILTAVFFALLIVLAPTARAAQDLEALQEDARLGDVTVQNQLGINYEIAQGVSLDLQEAAKWYRRAAEHGDAYGQFSLAIMYCNLKRYRGAGFPANYEEGYFWSRLAITAPNRKLYPLDDMPENVSDSCAKHLTPEKKRGGRASGKGMEVGARYKGGLLYNHRR